MENRVAENVLGTLGAVSNHLWLDWLDSLINLWIGLLVYSSTRAVTRQIITVSANSPPASSTNYHQLQET